MLRDAVILLHILLGSALSTVRPGLAPQGLQQGSALRQLLQSFWVAALRMELCKAPFQHILNLHAFGADVHMSCFPDRPIERRLPAKSLRTALHQLLQSFWVAALRMQSCRALVQQGSNLHAFNTDCGAVSVDLQGSLFAL